MNNPWAGLASYQDPAGGSTLLFCGRDNESYDLAALVDDNIFCTLYGKSGTGKTSLLNAGVFPRLRAMGYLPVSIRLGMEAMDTTFQQCIASRLGQTATLETTDTVALPADDQDEQWLWAWFARTRFVDGEGKRRFAVLVFDQFEEVFRSRRGEAEALLRQIHFMMDPSHTLGESYDYNFRFLASIREDDLYLLEDSLDRNFMGDMKQCRYRLNALTDEGARDVILKPGKGLFAEGEQDEIVNTIIDIARSADGSINTNILSLVCSRIYEEYRRSGARSISLELVRGFVSGNPFEQFYNEVTRDLGEKEKRFIEDRLVDAAGRRGSVSEPDFEKNVPNGAHLLEGTGRILQRVASGTEGRSYRIELIHDSFCAPLSDQKMKRAARRRRRITIAVSVVALVIAAVAAWIVIMSVRNARQTREILIQQERFYAYRASQLLDEGDTYTALLLLSELMDSTGDYKDIPLQPEAEYQIRRALLMNDTSEWQMVRAFRSRGVICDNFFRSSYPQVTSDGRYLVVGINGGLSIFDYQTGSFVKYLQSDKYDQADEAPKLSISHDGKMVSSVYYGSWPVVLRDIETGKEIVMGEGWNDRTDGIKYSSWNEARFSCDDQSVIVLTDSTNKGSILYGSIKAFDIKSGKVGYEFDASVRMDALESGNQQGGRIATADNEDKIYIFDINNGELLYTFDIGECMVWKYLSNNTMIVIREDAVFQYDISKKEWTKVIDRSFDMELLDDAQLSKDLLMVSNADTLFMYDIANYQLNSTFKFDKTKYYFACLNQYDNNLILGDYSGVLYSLKHSENKEKKETWRGYHEEWVRFIGDSLLFFTCEIEENSNYCKYELRRVNDNSLIYGDTIKWYLRIKDVSPNGQYVLLSSERIYESGPGLWISFKYGLILFDVYTGDTSIIDCDYDWNVFFISDSQFCYLSKDSNYNKILYKYDLLSKENYLCDFEEDLYPVSRNISNNVYLLSGGTLYDYNNSKVVGRLSKPMYSGLFSPDGKYILSNSTDGVIRLYKSDNLQVVDSCFGAEEVRLISSDNRFAVIGRSIWSLSPMYRVSELNVSFNPLMFTAESKSILAPQIGHDNSVIGFMKLPILSQNELSEEMRKVVGTRRLTAEEKSMLLE